MPHLCPGTQEPFLGSAFCLPWVCPGPRSPSLQPLPVVCCLDTALCPHSSPAAGAAGLSPTSGFDRALCLSAGGLGVCSEGAERVGWVEVCSCGREERPLKLGSPVVAAGPGVHSRHTALSLQELVALWGSSVHSNTPPPCTESLADGMAAVAKEAVGQGPLYQRQMWLGLGSLGRVSLRRRGPRWWQQAPAPRPARDLDARGCLAFSSCRSFSFGIRSLGFFGEYS